MIIFLIGFMGCGKSTLGKKLALNIEYDFIDLDIYIQDQESKSINEIFKNGEDYFRKIERVYLQSAMETKNTVIAVGGGTPCYFNNMQLMKENGLTIYIDMHPTELISRLRLSKKNRPLIASLKDNELSNFVFENLNERKGYYNKAHKIVDGSDISVKQLQLYCQ
tara:strand:+ start:2152 stop:2646 length:495 start_codon:yes stop_codon:yes gene_type:complete